MTTKAWIFAALAAGALGLLCGCEDRNASGSAQAPRAEEGASLADIGGPATRDTEALFAGEFEAVGVEPFWTLDVLQDWVSFSRLNLQTLGALPGTRVVGAKGMRLEAGPLLVTLISEPCVHVSGETYQFTAAVRHDGIVYTGCARPLQSGEGVSWVVDLAALLPAIDTCLGRARSQASDVTFAYLTEEGEVSVRLLTSEGGRFECIAAKDGSKVRYFEAIGDRDVLPGEREPIFTRSPGEPPTGPCLKSEPAPDGVGSFSRRIC